MHSLPCRTPVRAAARRLPALLALLALTACGGTDGADGVDSAGDGSALQAADESERHALAATDAAGGRADELRFIVRLHPAALSAGATGVASARALAAAPPAATIEAAVHGQSRRLLADGAARPRRHYARAIQGFSFSVAPAQAEALLQRLRADPAVLSVEPDGLVRSAQVVKARSVDTAHWGVDRVDQRKLPLDRSYAPVGSGRGVSVYVIDSGISPHRQFDTRLAAGVDFVGDGHGSADCRGHGTHVAGSIAGFVAGVAPGATLVPVRVLDCDGISSIQRLLLGIEWVIEHAARPAVINMSLGAYASEVIDEAVLTALQAGLHVAVSAGNDNVSACLRSPARVPGALTVGASNGLDQRSSFSNFGSCVDLFAPGEQIMSADWRGTEGERLLSGTSMAAPHAAGAMALQLESRPGLSPAQLVQQLLSQSTSGRIASVAGSPNRLLFTGAAPQLPFPVVQDIHVGLVNGETAVARTQWTARVSVRVVNRSGQNIAGIKVTGLFGNARTPLSCTTAASGLCTLVSSAQPAGTAALTLAVRTLEGSAAIYRSERNVASTITLKRPKALDPR